jgi:uncharacterized protein DUF483
MYKRDMGNPRTIRASTKVKTSIGTAASGSSEQQIKGTDVIDLRQAILDCLNSSLPLSNYFSAHLFSDALTELYWVISGIKHNAQIYVSELLLDKVVAACEVHTLHYSTSSRTWKGQAYPSNPAYYNVSVEVPHAEKISRDQRLRLIFITREACELKVHKSPGNLSDIRLGSLLGYPDCCIKFFNEHWREACNDYEGDVTPFIIANSQSERGFPFQNNHLTGLFGVPLVSHLPCSFSCRATIKQTNERLTKMSTKNPKLCNSITRLMKCPFLYSQRFGAALMTNWKFIMKSRISCVSASLTENSYWGEILEVSDFIESDQQGRVVLVKGGRRRLLDQETILTWR